MKLPQKKKKTVKTELLHCPAVSFLSLQLKDSKSICFIVHPCLLLHWSTQPRKVSTLGSHQHMSRKGKCGKTHIGILFSKKEQGNYDICRKTVSLLCQMKYFRKSKLMFFPYKQILDLNLYTDGFICTYTRDLKVEGTP